MQGQLISKYGKQNSGETRKRLLTCIRVDDMKEKENQRRLKEPEHF